MAFRIVMIENEVEISVKLNNLIVKKKGKDIWIPLDDISMIVMDNLVSTVSLRTLCQLAQQGIELLVCNQEHLPIGYYGAYANHSRASKVLRYQIHKSADFYNKLWKQIVKNKISNQAKAYMKLKNDEVGRNRIMEFSYDIKNGDSSNREAHAAKVYFNQLMDASFSRGNDDILLNSGLNYGYAIIRGYIARVCVGYGLNTQIGIHHKNEYNRFNLVDDLMEPIRPIVDIVAYKMLEKEKYFKPEHRKRLVNILNQKMNYKGKKMYLCNILESYVEQYAALIMGRIESIVFPDVNYFECEEEDEL